MVKLCVNIDHIATIREARKGRDPDPLSAAVLVELAGANGISVHLREDRRHIQERDVKLLRQIVSTRLNLEINPSPDMVQFAIDILPDMVTFVPENREEITTENGLNIAAKIHDIEKATLSLKKHDIFVSHFIEPELEQIKAAKKSGASGIELNTGHYCSAYDYGEDEMSWQIELDKLEKVTQMAIKYELPVTAGQGLNYNNAENIASIVSIQELNIGHAIVSRAALTGMEKAVKDMINLLNRNHKQECN